MAHNDPDPAQAAPTWFAGLGFAVATAVFASRLVRKLARLHGQGWMQAWPLDERVLARWLRIRSGLTVFVCMAWPAALAGSAWVAGHGVGAALAGNALGAMAGAWGGHRWWVSEGAGRSASASLAVRDVPTPPFLGLAQLRHWQRRAIGLVGLRRWAKWVGLLLLSYPSASLSLRGVLQLLLFLWLWPLYARAMSSSLSTALEASRVLAATPLPAKAWLWRLLPLPIALATGLAITVVVDLWRWMHLPPWVAVAAGLSIMMLESLRVSHCGWQCRSFRGVNERWRRNAR